MIDEYDVPLENAYFNGFYEQMLNLIRSVFESALKTNNSLEFAVLTGCLRIFKESIFTGLNNLSVHSVMDNSFSEYFGFTESEVDKMLKYYQFTDKFDELKKWYDGYRFGNTEIYNPPLLLNFSTAAPEKPSHGVFKSFISSAIFSINFSISTNPSPSTAKQNATSQSRSKN